MCHSIISYSYNNNNNTHRITPQAELEANSTRLAIMLSKFRICKHELKLLNGKDPLSIYYKYGSDVVLVGWLLFREAIRYSNETESWLELTQREQPCIWFMVRILNVGLNVYLN